jgi:hypothetical protein
MICLEAFSVSYRSSLLSPNQANFSQSVVGQGIAGRRRSLEKALRRVHMVLVNIDRDSQHINLGSLYAFTGKVEQTLGFIRTAQIQKMGGQNKRSSMIPEPGVSFGQQLH